jgi:ABC-2 type transport system permease protein
MATAAPLLQLILFAFAATTDLKDARLALCDRDGGTAARQLATTLSHQRYFRVYATFNDPRLLLSELDDGHAQLTLDIPPGFTRDLARGRTTPVQVLVDGSDSNTAQTAVAYLTGAVRQFSDTIAVEARRRHPAGSAPVLNVQTRVWYNPELKSRNFMVPGIVALILLVITTNFTALSVVRERENGTLEQLVVTPLRPFELLLGKMIPVALIGLLDAALIVLASVFLFHVPLRGSIALLFALSGGYLLCTLGQGLLISTVSRTQQQAQMTNFFLTMPAILISGFIFPLANMPLWAQYLSYLTPVRYFVIISRGIYLKGNDVSILWPQGLALLVLGVCTLAAGVLLFRKRVD